jgi:hypothetical protein
MVLHVSLRRWQRDWIDPDRQKSHKPDQEGTRVEQDTENELRANAATLFVHLLTVTVVDEVRLEYLKQLLTIGA